MVRNRHINLKKLNAAIADVVNGFAELDVVKAWGDGTSVAADGTQVDTYIDNLLAETSIRYGGFGGIAYHYISDTYVALFSRFIPCGVAEPEAAPVKRWVARARGIPSRWDLDCRKTSIPPRWLEPAAAGRQPVTHDCS
jgi:TnpA family transposase